ncbi:hypothetical protein Pmani_038426 [Petrolisthes manimaculis]|uniref:Uncharacterized protein n=1 Tax=Petrolisthes manimaculis TaxID=1843537 RepID=A0AAE1NEF9_9EUCA|nr:hypothetical protein Pmani_038426 [Petrolisthes manimaculis]
MQESPPESFFFHNAASYFSLDRVVGAVVPVLVNPAILGFHTNWTQLKLVSGNQKLYLEEDDTHSSGHNYCIAGHPWARLQKEQGLTRGHLRLL